MRRPIRTAWRTAYDVVDGTVSASSKHNVSMMASSMAFWLLLTLAPFALVLSVLAQLLRQPGTRTTLAPGAAVGLFAGDATWVALGSNGWSAAVTLVIVLFAASSFFIQYVNAVERIWGEQSESGPVRTFARRHLLGFLLVGILAVGLLFSVVAGSVVAGVAGELAALARSAGLPEPGWRPLLIGRFVVDLTASFALFLVAFTLVPARRIRWRDVVSGAALTGVAYALGQATLSGYLATSSRITMAGSLGGLIGLLLWVYYTSLIALYGAEFTRIVVLRREARRAAA